MYELVNGFANDDSGATLAEYGLLVGLIAVVCIAMVQGLGLTLNTVFSTINADFFGI